jgi:hypothetical protein
MKKESIKIENKGQWLACSYCSLAFSSEEQYYIHARNQHAGRNKKLPDRIAQLSEEVG